MLAILGALSVDHAAAEAVPLKSDHGTFAVQVVLNGQITLGFTLDSGAADVSIPQDVFSTLVRAGTVSKTDLLDFQQYELADGSQSTNRRFVIRSMRVGNVELTNVTASVAPAAGTLLLGQTFLSRLQSWSIDNQAHVLLINEAPPSKLVAENDSRAAQPEIQSKPVQKSSAAEWILLGNMGTTAFYLDRTSLQLTTGVRKGWIKAIYSPHTERDPMPGGGKKWVHVLMYQVGVSCGQKLMRTESSVWYHEDGSWFSAPKEVFPTSWESAAPSSLGDRQIKTICEQ